MFDPQDLLDFVDVDERATTPLEEAQWLKDRGILPHHQRYRNIKLIRYILKGNRGPGVTERRREEILKLAQQQWIGRRVSYLGRAATIEFLMPLNRAYAHRRTANPAMRSFEAWFRWDDTGRRNNSGVALLKLDSV